MVEEKLPKIDTGQIEEIKREDSNREWKYKNNNHHITHNNHTANVSTLFCNFFGGFWGQLLYYLMGV